MPVVCVGVGHHTAPVALRERLSVAATGQEPLLRELAGELAPLGFREVALLSTCNRIEFYAASSDLGRARSEPPAELGILLAHTRRIGPPQLVQHCYQRFDSDAVRHLCRVASGLESMVLGEAEILGQVSAAQQTAERGGTFGPVLQAVFRTAVRAGRRARAETAIGRAAASISSEAVRLVQARGVELGSTQVLIVGTGKVGRLAARALHRAGARHLSIVSRTAASASGLAREWNARALPWHALAAALGNADVVISGTGAPHAVLSAELIASVLADRRPGRPLLLMDLAVPRDVEPAVREFRGVSVYDLDDVQRLVADHLTERRREVPAVEGIIAAELERFEEWRHGAALRSLLAALAARGEAVRRQELARTLARLGPAASGLRLQLEGLSRTIVAKLLHTPLVRMREESDPGRRELQVEVVRHLFGLEAPAGAPEKTAP